MWEKVIMATVNDAIMIMQQCGVGKYLPPAQYNAFYQSLMEKYSKKEKHDLYVLGWKRRNRHLRTPIVKLHYIMEDIDNDLLEKVIINNLKFQDQIGLPKDRLATFFNTLIKEYNKCNG